MYSKSITKEIGKLEKGIQALCDWRTRCRLKYGGFEHEREVRNALRRDRRRLKKLLILNEQAEE